MSKKQFIDHFINKTVPFKFHGQELKFHLSQSLFSSHDVDLGSRRLLKTVSAAIERQEIRSVLDVGCGVGLLGISLKKWLPELSVTFQDRDALALTFTELNAKLNQIGSIELVGELALDGLGQRKYDLILSNLPGKAGPPVLKSMLNRIPGHLTGSGIAAVVIVQPLATLVRETLIANGSPILLEEQSKGYVVFHFQGGSPDEAAPGLTTYLRGSYPFPAGKAELYLKSAFNLPEFDTLSYQTRLAARLLKDQQVSGRVLFWKPGQGYIPALLASNPPHQPAQYVVAGRDLLSLRVTELNLRENGISSEQIVLSHLPHYMEIDGKFDFIILMPDIDPGVPWAKSLLDKSADLLHPGARLLLTAKSAFVHRLLAAKRGLRMETSKRRDGYRALLLSKQ